MKSRRRDSEPGRRDSEPGKRDSEPGRRDGEPGKRDSEPGRRAGEPGKRDGEPAGRRDSEPGRREERVPLRRGPPEGNEFIERGERKRPRRRTLPDDGEWDESRTDRFRNEKVQQLSRDGGWEGEEEQMNPDYRQGQGNDFGDCVVAIQVVWYRECWVQREARLERAWQGA